VNELLNIFVAPAIVAAVIGFILSLIRDERVRTTQVRSINTAILAEVQRLVEVVKRHKEEFWGKLSGPDKQIHPLIPFTYPIYKEQSKNIGQLTADVSGKVAKLYGYIQFLNSLQKTRESYLRATQFPEFDKLYTTSLNNFLDEFGTQFDDDFRNFGLK
jgi:rRNA processing protein Gar1